MSASPRSMPINFKGAYIEGDYLILRVMASTFSGEAILISGYIVETEAAITFMNGWPWPKAEAYCDDNGWKLEIMQRVRLPPDKKVQFEEIGDQWRHIGFSGSREGMTYQQKETLKMLLEKLKGDAEICWFRHGDCVGADKEAHQIARRLNYRIIIHPPDKDDLRAFCEDAFSVLPPKPYLDRNKRIVKKADFLLAAPKSKENQRGGTWYTITQATKRNLPMRIIYPDGSFDKGGTY